MIATALALQLAATQAQATRGESRYETPALAEVVARAAAANRSVPRALAGIRARVESEAAMLMLDSIGRERFLMIEQYAGFVSWTRGDGAELHVVGVRSPGRPPGVPLGSEALAHACGWTVPHLYGNRFIFRAVELHEPRDGERFDAAAHDTIQVAHPLAADRERFYVYSGGDTVATIRSAGRVVPLVRVHVVPRAEPGANAGVFEGDLYLDATRQQIVRVHGRVTRLAPPEMALEKIRRATMTAGALYVEITSGEVEGQFWVPVQERVEWQVGSMLLGANRSALRYVANFRDHAVTPSVGEDGREAPVRPTVITLAPRDSLAEYGEWWSDLGAVTTTVSGSGFRDLAPDAWKARPGAPRLVVEPRQDGRLLHFNRVEGVYTGIEEALYLRSAMPGAALRAFGGWAWSERTARGGMALSVERGPWITALRGERALESTNDFGAAGLWGGAALGVASLLRLPDPNDYVDRRSVSLAVTRILGVRRALVTAEGGFGRDASEVARITGRGLFGALLRENRPAWTGGYARGAVELEINPQVTSMSVASGVGVRLHVEAARGELAWRRATVHVEGRRSLGALVLGARVDGGVVTARHDSIPPQQLFELGGPAHLAGYQYKEFVGDRAAVLGGFVHYPLPGRLRFTPGIGGGFEGGWTGLSGVTVVDGVATGRVRGAVSGGLTLFSGLLKVGVSRTVERDRPWRGVVGVGW